MDIKELYYVECLLKKSPHTYTTEEIDLLLRCYIEVDVKCPRCLLIAFLLERAEDGSLVVNLKDKMGQVYDGETLLEAFYLGYQVTKVRTCLVYPRRGPVLEKYMRFSFENKAKHTREEAEYHIYKAMMNSCTGKFSQHVVEVDQHLFSTDKDLVKLLAKPGHIKSIEWLREEGNDHLGYYVEVEKELDFTKPCQIGFSVLSKSKRLMSEYTRKFNGYLDPEDCPYYCDTDSLLLHADTYQRYKDCGIFGNTWGLLKDEFGPKCKIVSAFFPSPKTYALEIWALKEDGTIEVKWHIRAKGIPKGEHLCNTAAEFEKLEHTVQAIPLLPGDLKEILFSLHSRDGKRIKTTISLPFYFFEAMMIHDCYVVVHYGTLKRYLLDEHMQGCQIKLNLSLHRTINKESWWKSDATGKRTLMTEHDWGASVPEGHIMNSL
jgi:hypothetical protein